MPNAKRAWLLRERLRAAVSGNGTFDEEEYVEHVASDVERAQAAYAALLEKARQAASP